MACAQGFDSRLLMIFLPLFLLFSGAALEYSGIDLWWFSKFYDHQNHLWPFKNHWLFDTVIHTWGQNFSKGMGLVWLMLFVLTFFKQHLKEQRKRVSRQTLASQEI